MPVLPETVTCLAGLTAMRLATFATALACGAVPLGFTFALIGHLGDDAPVTTLALTALAPLAAAGASARCRPIRSRDGPAAVAGSLSEFTAGG
jgi:uncharacterized membrane protein YdjX (TVP38/TMEM64 family)